MKMTLYIVMSLVLGTHLVSVVFWQPVFCHNAQSVKLHYEYVTRKNEHINK